MNQNLPRKIGELQAFAVIGLELLERTGATADTSYGDMAPELRSKLEEQLSWATLRANQDKAAKTITKLRAMMEHYIGDDWHNPVEVLEWSGFYFGAAAVHWSLVAGLLEETDKPAAAFSSLQVALYQKWLNTSIQRIKV